MPEAESSEHNIAAHTPEERECVNIDLAAFGVAYNKECINMPVLAAEAERQQPENYREYFRERLDFYRELSRKYPSVNYEVYAKFKTDK